MIITHPELITVKEAAGILRFHEDTLRRKIERGEIPGVERYGTTIRINRAALFHMSPGRDDESGRK